MIDINFKFQNIRKLMVELSNKPPNAKQGLRNFLTEENGVIAKYEVMKD